MFIQPKGLNTGSSIVGQERGKISDFWRQIATDLKGSLGLIDITQVGTCSLHEEDKKLVAQVLKGDERAFDLFYEDNYDRVFRFCMRRVNDEDTGYDLIQQTMERAVKYLHTYKGEASLYTWLCQICRNEIGSWYKKSANNASQHVYIDDDPSVRAILESEMQPEPAEEDAKQELSEIVHIAIDALPARYAEVLEAKYLKGLSVEEISQQLELTYLATESLLARSRRAFKSLLKDLMSEHPITTGARL